MTERGLPSVDDAVACPFVAFEKDREGRSTSADRRHRCYAEPEPRSRAAAHQEAYCLSSSFPVCPTFQDWARREAAHAIGAADRPAAALSARPAAALSDRPKANAIVGGADRVTDAEDDQTGDDEDDQAEGNDADDDGDRQEARQQGLDEEPPIIRNPPRDWAAPPPWATGGATGGGRRVDGSARSDESRGLAGSAADRLATDSEEATDPRRGAPEYRIGRGIPPDDELAGPVGGRGAAQRPFGAAQRPSGAAHLPPSRPGHRPSVSSSRAPRAQRVQDRDEIVGPSWEGSRRFEAYPTIRARAGLPTPPRLAVLAAALVIAAVGLFFLPAMLGVGGDGGSSGGGSSSASPSASAGTPTASHRPTPTPTPTSEVYVIQSGDTLFGVAATVGLTLEELLAANPQITDPDKIAAGDEILIPPKPPDEFTDPSSSPFSDPSLEPSPGSS